MAYAVDPVAVQDVATHTRASAATCWNVNGVLETKAVDVLRYQWAPDTGVFQGALWEPASANLLLNSATLATQSRSVATGTTYTLSFRGTGQVRVDGGTEVGGVVATTRTVTGTGATALVTLTFIARTGTLTFTPTGSVTKAQLEALGFATSWIETAGSSAVRSADVFSGAGMFNSTFTDSTPAYSSVTTYALGTQVQKDRRIFESLDGGNLDHTPLVSADTYHPRVTYPSGAVALYERQVYTSLAAGNVGNQPDESPAHWKAWWLNVAPSNDFAMFDRLQGVPSVGANGQQVFAFKTVQAVDAVVLFGVEADVVHIAISNGAGGLVTRSVTVSGGVAVALDMAVPGGTAGGAVVSVHAERADGVVTIGEFVCGLQYDIGDARFPFSNTLKDFSERVDDPDFGDATFTVRGYSQQIEVELEVETPSGSTQAVNAVMARVRSLRARPTVWVLTDVACWASVAVVYGTFTRVRTVVQYATLTVLALDLDGLVQQV